MLLDTVVNRMSANPTDYCEGDYFSNYGMIVFPGLLIYAIIIPVYLIWWTSKKSTIIYQSGVT